MSSLLCDLLAFAALLSHGAGMDEVFGPRRSLVNVPSVRRSSGLICNSSCCDTSVPFAQAHSQSRLLASKLATLDAKRFEILAGLACI